MGVLWEMRQQPLWRGEACAQHAPPRRVALAAKTSRAWRPIRRAPEEMFHVKHFWHRKNPIRGVSTAVNSPNGAEKRKYCIKSATAAAGHSAPRQPLGNPQCALPVCFERGQGKPPTPIRREVYTRGYTSLRCFLKFTLVSVSTVIYARVCAAPRELL